MLPFLWLAESHIVTTLQAGHLKYHDSITGRDNIFISSPNCPYQLCVPPSLLFSMYHGQCPEVKQLGSERDNTNYLVRRLKMCEAIPYYLLHLHDAHRDNFTFTLYLSHQVG